MALGEQSPGASHTTFAIVRNNLAQLLRVTDRIVQAKPLMRRHLEIPLRPTAASGHPHPYLRSALGSHASLLQEMGWSHAQTRQELSDPWRRTECLLGNNEASTIGCRDAVAKLSTST